MPKRAAVVGSACAVSLTLLAACESSLTVSGFVPDADCTMELWTMAGPIGQAKERTLVRKAIVGRSFEVEWTLGGSRVPHWLTITCPTGETFESERFGAGRAGDRVELGHVRLKPPPQDAPPP